MQLASKLASRNNVEQTFLCLQDPMKTNKIPVEAQLVISVYMHAERSKTKLILYHSIEESDSKSSTHFTITILLSFILLH